MRTGTAISWTIWPVALLVAMSLMFVPSTSYPAASDESTQVAQAVVRQGIAVLAGLVLLFALMRTTYGHLRATALPILAVSLIMLVLVLLPWIGIEAGGARRWLGIGQFRIQPSEISKLAIILYLAAYASKHGRSTGKLSRGLLEPLVVLTLTASLVALEPDLGTAIVLVLTGMSVLYVSGAQTKHLCVVFAVFAAVAVGLTVKEPYRLRRVTAWVQPAKSGDHGYQVLQSLISVSSGGLLGRNFGRGEGKYYLPAASTDYIMATVAEELGLWGVLIVVGCISAIVHRAYVVARSSEDRFASLTATGIGALFMWQAVLNLAVVTNMTPSTGVPMPLLSSGGSSMTVLLAAVGILLSPDTPVRGRRA